jgi:Ca2+-binding RTX toxin-like protein
VGGTGNDIYTVDNVSDAVTENAGEGTDTVRSSVNFTLGANLEHLTLTGTAAVNGTGNSGNNTIIGNSGANTLAGDVGNDTLIAGEGDDTFNGGTGADLYQTGRGDGTDQIVASANDGSADQLTFSGDIDSDQLWFSQSGDDLVISLIGTNDSMTVRGWYSAGNDQLDRINSGDGDYLLTNDVEALVFAMSSLSPPPIGQTELTTQQQQQLAPVLAASWHSAA